MSTDIAFITHGLGLGGAEYIVRNLATDTAKHYSVAVVALDTTGELAADLQGLGIPVKVLARKPGWHIDNFTNFFSVIRELEPRLIHAHQYTPYMFAVLYKIMFAWNCKLVFTEHGRHFPDLVSLKRKLANMFFSIFTDRVTAVCNFAARALRRNEFILKEVEIIYNGIEPAHQQANQLRAEFKVPAERKLIAFIGSFRPVKNARLILEAAHILYSQRRDWHLLLIGDGAMRTELEGYVKANALCEHVSFVGARANASAYISQFDIFVQPSLCEAHSLALLEALSAEVPVVATAVGGTAETIQDQVNGLLCPSGDAKAMASMVARLLDQPDFAAALAAQGKKDFLQRFAYEKMLQAYLDIYREELA